MPSKKSSSRDESSDASSPPARPRRRGVPYVYEPPNEERVQLSFQAPVDLNRRLEGVVAHARQTGWPPGCASKQDVEQMGLAMILDFIEAEYGGPWKPPAETPTGRPPSRRNRGRSWQLGGAESD